MRAKTFVSILILVLAVLIIAGSCATGKKFQMPDRELFKKLSGTWVNNDYDKPPGGMPIAKRVIKRNGTFDAYADTSDTSRTFPGEFIAIEEQWIDTEGNFFYKATYKDHTNTLFYQLGKIHNSGTVWEHVFSAVDYPNEIDPNLGYYRIYYRQE